MPKDFVQTVQALVFGECFILKELGLPAVQAAQPPTGGGDFFDIMAFQQVARG